MRVIFQVNYTYFHPINCIQIYRNQNPDEFVQEGTKTRWAIVLAYLPQTIPIPNQRPIFTNIDKSNFNMDR